MVACGVQFESSESADAGVLFDEKAQRFLGFRFKDQKEAYRFNSACERTGVNLYADLPYSELKALVLLWRDADKRGG